MESGSSVAAEGFRKRIKITLVCMKNLAIPHVVVTSINAPNKCLEVLADGAKHSRYNFIIVGDTKSPRDFELAGADYYDVERQQQSCFDYARKAPFRHYCRKNVGYLAAFQNGAPYILETDDDNLPKKEFWRERSPVIDCYRQIPRDGWLNVYRYFTDAEIWPRGYPLQFLKNSTAGIVNGNGTPVTCMIQQGLADDNPDVDAVYRLIGNLPIQFSPGETVILNPGQWCPFNSQNTCWWPEAYLLMYLPAHCSFRMTDIWRSFVAERIFSENGWCIGFQKADVWQDRNEHDLLRDFEDEIAGYLNNHRIVEELESIELAPGRDAIPTNLARCYDCLIEHGWIGEEEDSLLKTWLADAQKALAGKG